ncbi:MAG TPA: phage tail tape measure protein [Phycisphaerales bacterium]|nr:phage tail tape measure protein [Phycisphaerales bacterium]
MARSIRLATLFVEFESNAKGFQRDLRDNERALGRMADFVRKNALTAVGALGAAAVAAAFEASKMAAAFDASVRKIAASVPGATTRINDLKRVVNDIATSKGLPADSVLGGLGAIAKEGVTSIEALRARFEALQKTADATGEEVANLAAPFDQILDVFGLTDDQLERVAATLAKISQQNGVGFLDFLQAFQTSAPTIRAANLSFDQGAAALGRLLSQGLSAKQTAAALKDEVEKLGRDGMAKLAEPTFSAADALKELDVRAAAAEQSAERLNGRLAEIRDKALRGIGQAFQENLLDPLGNLVAILANPDLRRVLFTEGAIPAFAALAASTVPKPTIPAPVPGDPLAAGLGAFFRGKGQPTPVSQELKDKAAQFSEEVRAALVKASDTLVDDLALALGELEKKYREVSAALTSDQRALFAQQFEQLKRDLDAALKAEAITQGLTPGLAGQGPGKIPLKDPSEALAKGTEAAADQAERYKREQKEANDEIERSRSKIRQQADAIQRTVRAAVQLGEAFGLVDSNLGNVLEGIGQVASELSVVAKNGLDFSSALSIAGGIATVVSGLFGESADAKRDREIRQQNTEAIRDLTKALVTQVSGQNVSSARSAVSALLSAGRSGVGRGKFDIGFDARAVADTLKPFGLSLRDLEDLLKEINPDLKLNTSSSDDFIASLKQMQQALDELNFRAFADSFAGQLALLQDQFDLMDVTNPLEQLEAIAKIAAQNSPVLKELLAGLDLSTQAGRDEAEKRILDVFKKLGLDSKSGGLTADQLGKLSSEELRDLLKQLESLIDQTNQQNGSQSGGGATTFGAISGVTEVTGNRLAGILTSADIHLAGIEAGIVDIRDLLAPLVLVNPPSLPTGLIPYTGPTVFEVHVYGAPDQATARGIGQTVGDAAVEAFDARLGARQRKRALAAGKATVNQ